MVTKHETIVFRILLYFLCSTSKQLFIVAKQTKIASLVCIVAYEHE